MVVHAFRKNCRRLNLNKLGKVRENHELICKRLGLKSGEILKNKSNEGIEIARQKGKYQGRRPNKELHKKIIECHILSNPPLSISKTAELLNTTISMVTRVCGCYKRDKN